MAHTACSVANFMLRLAHERGMSLTHMQLLKLVYIAHGWHLALENKPLIHDRVEAWKYGPVIPSVYRAFKKFGAMPIHVPIEDAISSDDSFTKDERNIMEAVLDNYGKYSGFQLSGLTHREGTPWSEVWHQNGGSEYRGAQIDDELLKNYYVGLLQNNDYSS